MEITTLLDLVKNYYSYTIIFIGAFLSFRHRAILAHFIWRRVFKISTEFSNPELQQPVNDQLDVEKYRIIFPKLKLKNIYQALALTKWCNENKIGYEQASQFNENIVYSECATEKIIFNHPKNPKLDVFWLKSLGICLYLLIGLICFLPLISGIGDYIFLTGKSSEKYFWLEKSQKANSAFSDNKWTIESNCDPEKNNTKLTQEEYSDICKLIQSKEKLEEHFKDSRWKSFIFFSIFFPIFLFLFAINIRGVKHVEDRNEFSKHLLEKYNARNKEN